MLSSLAVLATGLAGCADAIHVPTVTARLATASPRSAPRPSPAPTTIVFDASVKPVAPPELAGPPSREAAGEVAKYFLAQFPYIQATGDLTTWHAMSGELCKFCKGGTTLVTELAAEGLHGSGGELSFLDVQIIDHRPHEYAVLVWYREQPSRSLDDEGTVVENFPDILTASADMHLVWNDPGWTVESVAIDVHERETP